MYLWEERGGRRRRMLAGRNERQGAVRSEESKREREREREKKEKKRRANEKGPGEGALLRLGPGPMLPMAQGTGGDCSEEGEKHEIV